MNSLKVEDVLSSRGRVRILRILTEIGELNISEIARRARLNFGTTNRHLVVLEKEGIILHEKFGRVHIFRLNEKNHRARLVKKLISLW